MCGANIDNVFPDKVKVSFFLKICLTHCTDLSTLQMSVSFVVVQRVSCFGEKTTRRFMKIDLSFCEK